MSAGFSTAYSFFALFCHHPIKLLPSSDTLLALSAEPPKFSSTMANFQDLISISLPLPILLHALGLLLIGLIQVFTPSRSSHPPSALSGIATLAISLAYLSTSYMPITENVFLHASVPVRMILGAVALIKVAVEAGKEKSPLVVVALYDGLGGVALGWWLGRWDGRIEGY